MKAGNCTSRLPSCPFKQANAPPSNGAGSDTDAKWTGTFDDALRTCDSAREVAEAVRKASIVLHVSCTERTCLLQTHNEAYVLHFDKITATAVRKIGSPLPKNMHSLDSFIPPFCVPLNFYLDENLQVDLRARRAVVLAGAAGTGRAFSKFARPLEVATVDDLRYIVWSGDRATTHLVFEEFNFEAFIDNVKVKDIYRGV